jgi:S-adenosyl methyltransferase
MTNDQSTAHELADEPRDARALADVNTKVAHSARIWNYWLGGKDHYAADREVSDQMLAVMPDLPVVAQADREFLGRAVRFLTGEVGIRQFLDLGTGIPTANNTHEVAQAVAPDSRVVYVDNDPIVLAHARALLASTPQGATDYISADLREPDTILQAAARTLDFDRPVALTLLGILNFIVDFDEAQAILRRLLDAVPAGSYLVISHPGAGVQSKEADEAVRRWNEGGSAPLVLRSREDVTRFFDRLELLEPGVVQLPQWRPNADTFYTDREIAYFGGVGRKP